MKTSLIAIILAISASFVAASPAQDLKTLQAENKSLASQVKTTKAKQDEAKILARLEKAQARNAKLKAELASPKSN